MFVFLSFSQLRLSSSVFTCPSKLHTHSHRFRAAAAVHFHFSQQQQQQQQTEWKRAIVFRIHSYIKTDLIQKLFYFVTCTTCLSKIFITLFTSFCFFFAFCKYFRTRSDKVNANIGRKKDKEERKNSVEDINYDETVNCNLDIKSIDNN